MITKDMRDKLVEFGADNSIFLAGYLCGEFDGIQLALDYVAECLRKEENRRNRERGAQD